MRKSSLSFVLVALVVAACASTSTTPRRTPATTVAAWTGEMPISGPWLREHLPSGVLTYARIPHLLGLLAIPKGDAFDTALGSEANIRNLIDIQAGLANLGVDLPPVRLFENLRSPIEVAVVGLPVPSVTIGATLSFRSNADFEAFMAEVGQSAPVSLAAPLDARGFGRLVGTPPPVQIQVHFDAATGRMALYGSMSPDASPFEALVAAPVADTPHPMHALEAQIDDSGQGLFAWVDAAQALQMSNMFPDVARTLNATGANRVRALALGAGVANGKGRLKLLVDVGTDRANRPLPVISNSITATSVGGLRSLFLLSLPSSSEFSRLESLALASLPPEAENGWAGAKTAFAEATGTSIDEILSALGPELLVFSDRAGDFFGLHVRDRALLDSVLDRWAATIGAPIESRQIGGGTVKSWELPASFGMPAQMRQNMPPVVAGMLGRLRSRLYWVEDGDYLYLGGTPQVLIDRLDMGAGSSVAEWLGETQRIDVSSSLLAASLTTERLQRMMYNAYIGVMQTFADLVGAEYDVWSMPTANQLGLPERGAVGLAVNLGEPYLSLELSYESHPFEALFGGGSMAAVAGLGVAAAIALPAYQDYTIRAQVSEGLNLAAAPKAAVAASWTGTRAAPADRAAAGMTPAPTDTSGRYVESVDVARGEVVIRYGRQARPPIAMATLTLTPYVTADGSLVWRCGYADPPTGAEPIGAASTGGTTIARQYLPSACR